MNAMSLYWLLKMDDIREAFGFGGIVSGSLVCICVFVWCMFRDLENTEGERFCKKAWKPLAILSVVFGTLYAFTPTTKQLAIIYVAPRVANSEFVTETVPAEFKELYGLAKEWLVEKSRGVEKGVK